jgi:hypothetical protein
MTDQMTSVVDGITIGWAECSKCYTHYTRCACPAGPQEPGYVTKMRATPVDGQIMELRGTITLSEASSTPSRTLGATMICTIGSHSVTVSDADQNDDGTWTCHVHQADPSA